MAMATAMSCSGAGEPALQAVARGLRWTYSLLWHLCPHQGALVWADGHYNGAIKTRKMVQPAAAPEEDQAARHRSRQLRELYDWLAREAAAGGSSGREDVDVGQLQLVASTAASGSRRPSAALSPEDLTETEWFFLVSASYSFPPAIGLPGRAFARRGHVWLSGANEVDSKVFLRAILAKSAGIQTVVCIPIVDGVLEIGTTEKVAEDIGLIHYASSIFTDQHGIHIMPTLSEHSTSNPVTHIDQHSIQIDRQTGISRTNSGSDELKQEDESDGTEDDDVEIEEDGLSGSDINSDIVRSSSQLQAQLNMMSNDQTTPNAGASEVMECAMSELARDGCSNNVEEEIQMLMECQNSNGQFNLQGQDETCQSWHSLYEELCNGYPQAAGDQVTSPENTHYQETVLTILQSNARRLVDSNTTSYLSVSHHSSFTRWNPKATTGNQGMITQGSSQRMLKSILLSIPSHHCSYREAQSPESKGGEGASGSRKGDFSANHVLKERRRREKLNEKFITLRSLVPFVTKMDKASILGDTIEYVKQLRKRIHDLESPRSSMQPSAPTTAGAKRSRRAVEAASDAGDQSEVEVQVSIIENDALLELRCGRSREGLLLRVMQALQELQLDVTAVQASSSPGGVLLAELRAKVKEEARGRRRRSSIAQVKRAIHLVLSSP